MINRDFGFNDRAFQVEFAEFVYFIGGDVITRALERLLNKLGSITPLAQTLYRKRYFLQQQLLQFADQPNAFRLDTSDVMAVRAASYIAGVNRMAAHLPTENHNRLRGVLADALDPDGDARRFEHEVRSFIHLGRQGFDIVFPDMEKDGNGRIYDMLVTTPGGQFEVECKTVTGETGLQIKADLAVGLMEAFRKHVGKGRPLTTSSLFSLHLRRPAATIRNLSARVRAALTSSDPLPDEEDFVLLCVEKPHWQQAYDGRRFEELKQTIRLELQEEIHCAIRIDGCLAGLIVHPHKPSTITQSVIDVLKDAAKQCSSSRAAVVWLHFIDMGQDDFRAIVDLSIDGRGHGLNAAVSMALHDREGNPIRTHIERVRFSADVDCFTRRPTLAPDLRLSTSVSLDGLFYDVPNPRCMFQPIVLI